MPLDTGVIARRAAIGAPSSSPRPRVVARRRRERIGAALRGRARGAGPRPRTRSPRPPACAPQSPGRARSHAAWTQLPSRPFTIGYVRAYAKALGLDADARRPPASAPRPRTGDHELRRAGRRRPRGRPAPAAGCRHARRRGRRSRSSAGTSPSTSWPRPRRQARRAAAPATPRRWRTPTPPSAARSLSARRCRRRPKPPRRRPTSRPARRRRRAPPAVGAGRRAGAAVGTPFVAKGAVYGVAAGASPLIIQAAKPISLVVRGPGGVGLFRPPARGRRSLPRAGAAGLTAEVSNPASAELYVDRRLQGAVHRRPQMPLNVQPAGRRQP